MIVDIGVFCVCICVYCISEYHYIICMYGHCKVVKQGEGGIENIDREVRIIVRYIDREERKDEGREKERKRKKISPFPLLIITVSLNRKYLSQRSWKKV